MIIAYLADYPQHIPTIAAWTYGEWGHLNAGDSIERRITRFQTYSGRPGIPMTLIALEDETPVGCASLVVNDLSTHTQLTPFMASVFVDPAYRRRGVASALVLQSIATAAQLNIETLYLITHDRQQLYQNLGWSHVEELTYRGEEVTLMKIRCIAN